MKSILICWAFALLYQSLDWSCEAFVAPRNVGAGLRIQQAQQTQPQPQSSNYFSQQQERLPFRNVPKSDHVILRMALDPVTYLRTEWISAALCTNQTPRSADICLQLGCEDGRIMTFIPRTIREVITSSIEKDGALSISTRRRLKQEQDRRGAAKVKFVDQPADNLRETKDESVDVVISLTAAAKMMENGLDWKRSVREAARVLKPGGRFLFVEQSELNGESYLNYVENLVNYKEEDQTAVTPDGAEKIPMFEVGFDEVDLVLVPHIAGVAIKSLDAGLTPEERKAKEAQEEQDRLAELSLRAFEKGSKRRRKKKTEKEEEKESTAKKA